MGRKARQLLVRKYLARCVHGSAAPHTSRDESLCRLARAMQKSRDFANVGENAFTENDALRRGAFEPRQASPT
jgi:hypothetical protein